MNEEILRIEVKNAVKKAFAVKNATKTKSAQKVLQLMDQDVEYQVAVKRVSREDGIPYAQLEKELEPFI